MPLSGGGMEIHMSKRMHRDVYVSIGMLVFCIVFIMIAVRLPSGADNPIRYETRLQDCKKPVLVFLFVVGYGILFRVLGFFTATPIFLIALFRYLNAGSWKKIVLITLGYTVVIYVVFVIFLGVPLHRIGLLGGLFRFG